MFDNILKSKVFKNIARSIIMLFVICAILVLIFGKDNSQSIIAVSVFYIVSGLAAFVLSFLRKKS